MKRRALKRGKRGFTLIELLVVVLIIGILAAIAIPQYFRVVEKGRAAEALNFIYVLKGSQERRLIRNGSYTSTAADLDITLPAMKFFTSGVITAGTADWRLTLTRNVAVPTYGQYTITFNSNLANAFTGGGSASGMVNNDLLP